jgi:cysteinyl-tRNA synthetase
MHTAATTAGITRVNNAFGVSFDLMTVHHINEVAQSECAYDKTFCNFFVHGEMLNIKNEKMSKSKGNYLTMNSVIEAGHHPLSYRYFLLQTHYRKVSNFSWESLQAAENALQKLQKTILSLSHTNTRELDENYLNEFKKSLEDDLNIPECLATLWKLVKDQTIPENKKYWTALEMDRVFSLDLGKDSFANTNGISTTQDLNNPKIQELINLRNKYRFEKNWTEADKIRDELVALGVEVKDK